MACNRSRRQTGHYFRAFDEVGIFYAFCTQAYAKMSILAHILADVALQNVINLVSKDARDFIAKNHKILRC